VTDVRDSSDSVSVAGALPSKVSASSLVDAARALRDGIAARAERVEAERCVARDTIDELVETGLTRALQSSKFGGLERSPEEFFASVIEIGMACPSTAWVLAVLGVHPFEFAKWGIEAQEELFGDDPTTLVSSSYAPHGGATRESGGYRLSGRWRSSSGVDHCTWAVIGARLQDDSSEMRHFLVPASDYEIVDDWFVMGLAGTGSKSVVIDDVFVPEHRTIAQVLAYGEGPGLAVNTGPLYRIPRQLIYLGPGAAPAIGAAKGAYEEFRAQTRSYVSSRTNSNKADDPYVHLRLAEARATIDRVEEQMLTAYRDMMRTVVCGTDLAEQDNVRHSLAVSGVTHECVTAVRGMFEMLGASAIYHSNPMQRFYRDVLAMRQHGTQDRDRFFAAFGKSQLGA